MLHFKETMVTKIWNNCFPESSATLLVHKHSFYLCQWQWNTQVKIVYLLYRWLSAIMFLGALVCSLMDVGRREEPVYEFHYAKWWIYLTHWGLMTCTVQSWLVAWIVTQGTMVVPDEFDLQRHAKANFIQEVYWILYSVATVYSIIITVCYWSLVHDPEVNKIDAVNLMVHVLNSVLMFIDLIIVRHPFKLNHAYYTMGIGIIYTIFSAIYFLAGGTNRKLDKSIYPLLDWSKPGKTIVISACAVFFVFIVHFFIYCLYRIRICIYTKIHKRRSYRREKMSSIGKAISTLEADQKETFLNPSAIVDLKL